MQEQKENTPSIELRRRMDAAEQALENLQSYLQRRLRDLDAGRQVTGHQEACQEIMDLVGLKIVPAQPLTVVKK